MDNHTHCAHTAHPDAQWFATAGLGMFLHWGISSVSGDADISWSMIRSTPWDQHAYNVNKIKPSDYFRLAERFNPDQYDPEAWCAAAQRAGIRYVVLTTRHHDGYALWPSQYGDFSTRTHMGGRDLLAPYVQACRKFGLKVGFYYSPPDWHFFRNHKSFGWTKTEEKWQSTDQGRYLARIGLTDEKLQPLDVDWEPAEITPPPQSLIEEYKAYLRGQITELLTRYGKLDLIWFDGTAEYCEEPPMSVEEIRAIQPGIVVNPRMHGREQTDFDTCECSFPAERLPDWWEGCHVLAHCWGYTADELYKPLSWILGQIARHRAWNGNILLNFGPDPRGRLPQTAYERLDGIARWMDRHAESVFDVQGGRWPEEASVPETRKGEVSYLFMVDGTAISSVKTDKTALSAVVLETGEPVDHIHTDKGYEVFRLKVHQETDALPVIKVVWAQS